VLTVPPQRRVRHDAACREYVVRLGGRIDGSTACQALAALTRVPAGTREIVLDLSRLTTVEPFGLEILSRGLRGLARKRRVRVTAPALFLSTLGYVADSLLAEHV
jgi:anti-anti-sigma regulatory factor